MPSNPARGKTSLGTKHVPSCKSSIGNLHLLAFLKIGIVAGKLLVGRGVFVRLNVTIEFATIFLSLVDARQAAECKTCVLHHDVRLT